MKNMEKSLLTFASNIVVERSQKIFRTMYPNKKHMTTHPDNRTKQKQHLQMNHKNCKGE